MMFKRKSNKHKKQSVHIVLLGDQGVGKSQLIARGSSGQFSSDTKPTRSYQQMTTMLELNKQPVQLIIHDTPAEMITKQNRYYSNNDFFNSQAAIVVVDATAQNIVDSLRRWDKAIQENYKQAKNKILVVNKCDIKNNERSTEKALYRYAQQNRYKKIIYASAKDNCNIEDIFNTAARCVIEENSVKEHFKECLKIYVYNIESQLGNGEYSKNIKKYDAVSLLDKITINFAYNFSIFKASRADNREANYRLARKLLKQLEAEDSAIEDIFDAANIRRLRNAIIEKHALHTWYRGIHSETLNSIIEDARYMTHAMKQYKV